VAKISDLFRLSGGMNEEDPMFTLPSGVVIYARNHECLAGGGYRRIDGYERFDGHVAKPSSATYKVLAFSAGGPHVIVSGDTLLGVTSGKTAIVVGTTQVDSGAFASSTASGSIGVVADTGEFTLGEPLSIGGVHVATVAAVLAAGSVGDASYKSWMSAARDYWRTFISAVPGSGAVRGAFVLGGNVYAIRDNVGATAGVLHKATTSGWSAQTLTAHLRFNTGTAEVFEGDTITGATSGATAIVRRINIGSGNYAGPTFASGRFAITNVTGTFQAAENLQVAAVTKCKAVAAQAASVILPGGRFDVLIHNFFGASNLTRAYGCDGVNRAFEYDGTYFIFIETGMVTDTPNHIEEHRNYLFMTFPGGSLQNSGTATPLIWSPRTGAAEIGIGDDVTDLASNGDNQLAILGKRTVQILHGSSNDDWNLRSLSDEIGSVGWTLQEASAQTVFLDRAAVNVITTAMYTGRLGLSSISRNVRKTIERTASNAVGSMIASKKSQYRLYFNDKTALVATFSGGKLMGWMPMLYTHQFTCWTSGQDAAGTNRMYAGTSDGYLMELDAGTSFDGAAITSIQTLPYSYHRAPEHDKRFHRITLQVDTPREIDLRLSTDFDYGSGSQSGSYPVNTSPTGGVWDVSAWESFFWDSAVISAPEIDIDGTARNMGITLYHSDAVDAPFSIQACIVKLTVFGVI